MEVRVAKVVAVAVVVVENIMAEVAAEVVAVVKNNIFNPSLKIKPLFKLRGF